MFYHRRRPTTPRAFHHNWTSIPFCHIPRSAIINYYYDYGSMSGILFTSLLRCAHWFIAARFQIFLSNWRTITAVMLARNGDWHSDEKTSAPGACSPVRSCAPLYRFECQFNQFFPRRLVRPFPSDYSIRATAKINMRGKRQDANAMSEATTYRRNEIRVVHTSFVNLIIRCHCQLSIFVRAFGGLYFQWNGSGSISEDFC